MARTDGKLRRIQSSPICHGTITLDYGEEAIFYDEAQCEIERSRDLLTTVPPRARFYRIRLVPPDEPERSVPWNW